MMRASFRLLLVAVMAATLPLNAQAQTPAPILQEPQTIPLWEGKAPGAQGTATDDIPTLTIYMPPMTTGPMTAVIMAPGGSYRALSMNKEGRAPADYLNALGVAAFVLQLSARAGVSPSDRARRHAASHPNRPRPSG